MTGNLLAKRLKQAYEERYCSGTYSLELEVALDDITCYVFTYTYNDGYRVCLEITISRLGEVKFYSPVHCYYISNFGKSFKSTINVVRMLFDLLECNRETMLRYYGEESEDPTEEVAEQPTNEYFDSEKIDVSDTYNFKYISTEKADNANDYKKMVHFYRRCYAMPNRYERPIWSMKPVVSKEKRKTYRAFKQMVKDAYLYKNTLDRLFTIHSYLMKLHQKGKITTLEYYFYTNKLENMYNECLR